MSITLNVGLSLGPSMAGLTDLRAKLYDVNDGLIGSAFSTTFSEIGNGNYNWTTTTSLTGFTYVEFYSNAAPSATWAYTFTDDELVENATTTVPDGDAFTVTGREILMKMAQDVGEFRSAFVKTVTSQSSLVLGGLFVNDRSTFKYALAELLGGGVRRVETHNIATDAITLSATFARDIAVGETVKIAWWDADRKDLAMGAINEAIRMSWGRWGQEVIEATDIDLGGASVYDLPDTVGELWRVGIRSSLGDYDWRAPRDLWAIGGQIGDYTIQFLHNGRVFLPDEWAGETLYAWYLSKEAVLTTETDTTQLPLDSFTLATYIYLTKAGPPPVREGEDPGLVRDAYQAKLGQLKMDADAALSRLQVGRPKRPPMPRYLRRM